jgi:hypothetical protein
MFFKNIVLLLSVQIYLWRLVSGEEVCFKVDELIDYLKQVKTDFFHSDSEPECIIHRDNHNFQDTIDIYERDHAFQIQMYYDDVMFQTSNELY